MLLPGSIAAKPIEIDCRKSLTKMFHNAQAKPSGSGPERESAEWPEHAPVLSVENCPWLRREEMEALMQMRSGGTALSRQPQHMSSTGAGKSGLVNQRQAPRPQYRPMYIQWKYGSHLNKIQVGFIRNV